MEETDKPLDEIEKALGKDFRLAYNVMVKLQRLANAFSQLREYVIEKEQGRGNTQFVEMAFKRVENEIKNVQDENLTIQQILDYIKRYTEKVKIGYLEKNERKAA